MEGREFKSHGTRIFSESTSLLEFTLYHVVVISLLVLNLRHHNYLENRKHASLVESAIMSRVVKNNRGFLQLLAHCPIHLCEFLLRTATPEQMHALV